MTKVITNKTQLKNAVQAIKTQQGYYNSNSERIGNALSKIEDVSSSKNYVDSYDNYDLIYSDDGDFTAQANNYNAILHGINLLASSAESTKSVIENSYTRLNAIYTGVTNFESSETIQIEIDALKDAIDALPNSTYSDLSFYDSDGDADEKEDSQSDTNKQQTSSGQGGGSGSPDADEATPKSQVVVTTDAQLPDTDADDEKSKDDDKKSDGEDDGKKDSDEEKEKEEDKDSDGEAEDKKDDDEESNKEDTADGDGEAVGLGNDDDVTGADLIDTSGSALADWFDDSNGGASAGADDITNWESAAIGAGALIAGLSNIGANGGVDSTNLENLAVGLDGDRTLASADLDVFDHPDYVNGSDGSGETNLSAENPEINAAMEGIDGEATEGDTSGKVEGLDLSSSNSLNDKEAGKEGSNLIGAAATAGAGAAFGAAAAGFMAYDDQEGGVFDSGVKDEFGNTVGKDRTITEVVFGNDSDKEDEESRKKRRLQEKIAIGLAVASTGASLVTFILANMLISTPIWFVVSLLAFAGSVVYIGVLKDDKASKYKELGNVGGLTSVKPAFSNNQNQVQADANTGTDWALFGMVLLSTAPFILKTFDIISWLIFIILLILFILIIIVYIILKKKLGEE